MIMYKNDKMPRIGRTARAAAVLSAACLFAGLLSGCGAAGKGPQAQAGSAAVSEGAGSGAAGNAAEGKNAGSSAADKNAGNAAENKAAGSAAAAPAEKKELREVDVVLDWYPNALHTFIYTASARGYYEEEGLKVNVRFPANDNDALALVAAGRAELGVYYQHDVIQAVANQNIGLKSVGAIVQKPLNIVLSLEEKNIRSPHDLPGKLVGYSGTALSEALIRSMMQKSGEDPDSVRLQNVGFDLMSSMTTGTVDATIGCLVNHEVPEMEYEGFKLNYFTLPEYGVPNNYEAVFLTNDHMVNDEPEVLSAFLRASRKGFNDFKADPYGCLAILLDNQSEENFPLKEPVERQSCDTILPLMESDGVPFLTQDEACWQENIDWMYEEGIITRKPEVSEVMTVIPE